MIFAQKNIEQILRRSKQTLAVVIVLTFAYIAITAPLPILHNHIHRVVNIHTNEVPTVQKEIPASKCLIWEFYNNIFNSFYPLHHHIVLGVFTFSITVEEQDDIVISTDFCGISRAPPIL